jgi:hypothetical protein
MSTVIRTYTFTLTWPRTAGQDKTITSYRSIVTFPAGVRNTKIIESDPRGIGALQTITVTAGDITSVSGPQSTPVSTPSIPAVRTTGVSPGGAAGIGIGCAIAGALIASLVLCLFFRGRMQRERASRRRARADSYRKGSRSPQVPMVATGRTSTLCAIESALPPPKQDSDIAGDFSKLCGAIKNHAQSYYRSGEAPSGEATEIRSHLAELLKDGSTLDPGEAAMLLSSPRAAVPVARVLLAWTILQNVQPSADPELNLLPPELVECTAGMDQSNRNPGKTIPSARYGSIH